jgi:hypothetical protein
MKLYIYGAIALALGYLLWHERHLAHVVKAQKIEIANMAALEAAHAHELKIAKDASDGYQADLKRLESERSSEPAPVVRLCRTPHAVPAESGTPAGSNPASAPNDVEAAQTDIGPALIEYGLQCEANMLQLDRLRQWVESR